MGKESRRKRSSAPQIEQLIQSITGLLPSSFKGKVIEYTKKFIARQAYPWDDDKVNFYIVRNDPALKDFISAFGRTNTPFVLFHFDGYLVDVELDAEWTKRKMERWLTRSLDDHEVKCSICLEVFTDRTLMNCRQCEIQWCEPCYRQLVAESLKEKGPEAISQYISGRPVDITDICPGCRNQVDNKVCIDPTKLKDM